MEVGRGESHEYAHTDILKWKLLHPPEKPQFLEASGWLV